MPIALRLRVLPALFLTALLAACGGTSPDLGPDVWAVVDGQPITKADVERAYRSVVQPNQPTPPEEERLVAQLNVLDDLITQHILLARARAASLEVSQEDVDKAFAERRAGLADDAMNQQLQQRGLSADDVRDALRRELLVGKILERDVDSKIIVSDDEIAAYYEQNRQQFNVPEAQYRLAQIVVTPVRNPQTRNRQNNDAATPDEATRKTEMIFERLRGGADFSELALDYSEDPQSAPQGGDLGFISASQLQQAPAQLRDLVLKMKPGDVQTLGVGGGYTIVLLVAHEPAGQRDLTAVRDNIREGLRERKDRLLRTAYLTAARADADIDHRMARSIVDAQGKPPANLVATPGK